MVNETRIKLIKELVYVDLDEPISYGLKGLKNLGNTCYLNSIIQCLSQSTDLTKYLILGKSTQYLINNSNDSKIGLVIGYIRLISQLWNKYENIDPQFLTFESNFLILFANPTLISFKKL
jgi:ubiquitin C-terminal hydrolase